LFQGNNQIFRQSFWLSSPCSSAALIYYPGTDP
jgi:hypothetical protein